MAGPTRGRAPWQRRPQAQPLPCQQHTPRDLPPQCAAAVWQEVLNRVCPLPEPCRSDRESRRHDCSDLRDLDARELWREMHRAELRLALDDKPDPWIAHRFKSCAAEFERRRARGAA